MGIYGFICAGGGSVGVLAGGVLTSALGWHWVFLVNLPIGALVCALCFTLLSPDSAPAQKRRLDVAGALTVTLSSMLAIYAHRQQHLRAARRGGGPVRGVPRHRVAHAAIR